MRLGLALEAIAPGSVDAPSTSDWIAIVAVVLAVAGAWVAYGQLKSAKAELSVARVTARAQFLLAMDEAFAVDEPIRVRLAQRAPTSALTPDQWRAVKRYMGRLERVSVFVSQGLLDARVVHRLYGSRVKKIVSNDEVRLRLLESPERAASWVDFIELWRKLDDIEMRLSARHLCDSATPPARPENWDAHRTTGEDRGDETGTE